jgi:hypothetical protein
VANAVSVVMATVAIAVAVVTVVVVVNAEIAVTADKAVSVVKANIATSVRNTSSNLLKTYRNNRKAALPLQIIVAMMQI